MSVSRKPTSTTLDATERARLAAFQDLENDIGELTLISSIAVKFVENALSPDSAAGQVSEGVRVYHFHSEDCDEIGFIVTQVENFARRLKERFYAAWDTKPGSAADEARRRDASSTI